MSLLGGALFGGALYALYKGLDGENQNAAPKFDEKEFDDECMRYGILHNLNEEKILKIAARCRVPLCRTTGRLGRENYKRCLPYVKSISINKDDYKEFIKKWLELCEKQEKAWSEKIIKDNERLYNKIESKVDERLKDPEFKDTIINIHHWEDYEEELHRWIINELVTKTCIKDYMVQEPILRFNGNQRTETWVLKASCKANAKAIYSICVKSLGWWP